jgi:hypothetical protein
MSEEDRTRLISNVESYKKEFEGKLAPLQGLKPQKPAVFISIGGGELGDLAVTAAKDCFGGSPGGLRTVAFDRYQGFPAQDAADCSEVFDMMNGDLLEERITQYTLNLKRSIRTGRSGLEWKRATGSCRHPTDRWSAWTGMQPNSCSTS